jgi:hypothetical protein
MVAYRLEDGPMTWNQDSIDALVVRVQNEFLDRPSLHLTLPQAVQRFNMDKTTCGTVLDALVDARVLTKTRAGAYSRFFPRSRSNPIRQVAGRNRPTGRRHGTGSLAETAA